MQTKQMMSTIKKAVNEQVRRETNDVKTVEWAKSKSKIKKAKSVRKRK